MAANLVGPQGPGEDDRVETIHIPGEDDVESLGREDTSWILLKAANLVGHQNLGKWVALPRKLT